MDEVDLIAAYAQRLAAALRRAGRPTQPLVDEATAHLLEDAARIARHEACEADEAARRAITRFGDVASVVGASRRHGRTLTASVSQQSPFERRVRPVTVVLGGCTTMRLVHLGEHAP